MNDLELNSEPPKQGGLAVLLKGLPTFLVLCVMAVGWLTMHHINSGSGPSEPLEEEAVEIVQSDHLVLPDGKLRAAKFESEPVSTQEVRHEHTVPGRLRYDQTKHVDVKAPIDGILAELIVSPGDDVNKGDLVAVIRSPEIGQARAEIIKRQKARNIAQQLLDRNLQVANNLNRFIAMLDEGQSVDAIEQEFSELALGKYRRQVLSAYSQMRLADDLVAKVRPLVESGAVSGRTVREREGERQLAETEYRTARDEANFEIEKAVMEAEADLAEADNQLTLAWQSLETLLGYPVDKQTDTSIDGDDVATLEVLAPFDGSVESQGFARNERVMRGDSLIVLANTETLWVEANIRESDWSAVTLHRGVPVEVTVPAIHGQAFQATVKFFGREVQADTNSVPLVAEIDNHSGILRPGMFVRVTVPMGDARQALSVKPESLLQHDNEQFVFVQTDVGEFQKVDVETGDVSDEWVEVKSGLSPGQQVVTDGAFLLKSELLLQGEDE